MTYPPTFTPTAKQMPQLAPDAPEFVRPGERVLWQGKPTLLVLVRQTIGLVVGVFFFGIFSGGWLFDRSGGGAAAQGPLLFLLPLFIVFVTIIVFLNLLRLRRTHYVLTDQGVYTRTGIIGHTVIQTTFDKITDISLKQDVIGRILGFASLHVNTAGSNTAPVQMEGLRRAIDIKNHIELAREQALRGGRPEPAPRRALPRFVPERLLMTVTCPKTHHTFRRPSAELGKPVPCPHCQGRHKAEVKRARRARTS
ncbi:MAG TPA: PH domain-containing protein [Candidatus Thermoplasmatota archaeon]|nr:PH domain-containing protein [Candidatus Thermoplasmatota archaeon]